MTPRPIFVPPGVPPPADGRPFVVLASGRQRVAARLLDLVAALLAMTAPQLLLIGVLMGVAGTSYELMVTMALTALLVMVLAWLFLRVVRLVLWGCTVGQRIAGIRVIGVDHARNPGWKQAFNRWMPTWGGRLSPANTPWGDVAFYRLDRQPPGCLHDRAAGTVVIQAGKAEPVRRAALAMSLAISALALVLAFLLIT